MYIDDKVYKHMAFLAWGRRRDVSLQDILDTQVPADLRTRIPTRALGFRSFCKYSQYLTSAFRRGNAHGGSPLQLNGHYTSISSLHLQKVTPARGAAQPTQTEVQAEATGLLFPEKGLHSHPSEHLSADG